MIKQKIINLIEELDELIRQRLYYISDEILERKVSKIGNSGHISIPSKHIGKTAKIFILKEKI